MFKPEIHPRSAPEHHSQFVRHHEEQARRSDDASNVGTLWTGGGTGWSNLNPPERPKMLKNIGSMYDGWGGITTNPRATSGSPASPTKWYKNVPPYVELF